MYSENDLWQDMGILLDTSRMGSFLSNRLGATLRGDVFFGSKKGSIDVKLLKAAMPNTAGSPL